MNEKKITLCSILTGTGASFLVAVPMALLIAFATGFLGVMGQYLGKWIIRKFDGKKYKPKK